MQPDYRILLLLGAMLIACPGTGNDDGAANDDDAAANDDDTSGDIESFGSIGAADFSGLQDELVVQSGPGGTVCPTDLGMIVVSNTSDVPQLLNIFVQPSMDPGIPTIDVGETPLAASGLGYDVMVQPGAEESVYVSFNCAWTSTHTSIIDLGFGGQDGSGVGLAREIRIIGEGDVGDDDDAAGDDDDAAGDDDDSTDAGALVSVLNSGPETMSVVLTISDFHGVQDICYDLGVGSECSAMVGPGTYSIGGDSVGGCTISTSEFTVASGEAHTQEVIASDFDCD